VKILKNGSKKIAYIVN